MLGDGYEVIDILEIERYERPDVAQSLDVETEGFLPGFTVTIPEVLELRRKYDLLELLLLDGEEKHCFGSVRVMTWMNWSRINW